MARVINPRTCANTPAYFRQLSRLFRPEFCLVLVGSLIFRLCAASLLFGLPYGCFLAFWPFATSRLTFIYPRLTVDFKTARPTLSKRIQSPRRGFSRIAVSSHLHCRHTSSRRVKSRTDRRLSGSSSPSPQPHPPGSPLQISRHGPKWSVNDRLRFRLAPHSAPRPSGNHASPHPGVANRRAVWLVQPGLP